MTLLEKIKLPRSILFRYYILFGVLVFTSLFFFSSYTTFSQPAPPTCTPTVGLTATGGIVNDIVDGGVTYRLHTFRTSGTLNASADGCVEALVVAGGGAGGQGDNGAASGGGGGGGGVIYSSGVSITGGSHSITIGAGGGSSSANGNNSSIGTYLSAVGGGGGALANGGDKNPGGNGGSGGGGARSGPGGSGISGQGNNGGDSPSDSGGGGGGASANGGNGTINAGGNGGSGVRNNIDGRNEIYGSGGGGGNDGSGGGLGDDCGGAGGASSSGGNGQDWCGGGGGGGGGEASAGNGKGGVGGAGVVIIRYPLTSESAPIGGIDSVDCFAVTGWAIDMDVPTTSINVQLFDGNVLMGTYSTNVLRDDVNIANGVTGIHGFDIPVIAFFRDELPHNINVYAVNMNASGNTVGPNAILMGSPTSLTCTGPVPPSPPGSPPPAPPPAGLNCADVDPVCLISGNQFRSNEPGGGCGAGPGCGVDGQYNGDCNNCFCGTCIISTPTPTPIPPVPPPPGPVPPPAPPPAPLPPPSAPPPPPAPLPPPSGPPPPGPAAVPGADVILSWKLVNPLAGSPQPTDIFGVIYLITNWVLNILGSLLIILIIYSGVRFMISRGNPGEIQKAKSILYWALVGFAVTLIGKGFIFIIDSVLRGAPPF